MLQMQQNKIVSDRIHR